MPPADPVLVFDLDGTILRGNSFPRWVLAMMAGRIGQPGLGNRLRLALRMQSLLARRRLGTLDHDGLMRGMQAAWAAAGCSADESGAARLHAALLRQVRPGLGFVLGRVATGEADAVLATAAAEEYAVPFGRLLGFRHIVATRSGRAASERHNAGEEKRARVHALLREQGWAGRAMIFFTDHIDDLPLIRDSALVCWFGSDAVRARIAALAPAVPLIASRNLPGDGLARAFATALNALSARMPPAGSDQCAAARPTTLS